jgi:tryptophan-rich sensory protein
MDYLYWIFNQFSFGEGSESTGIYRDWYLAQNQPFFAPPPEVFGIAWGIIYPLMAIALVYTLYLVFKKRIPVGFLGLYILNIALNLTFTPTLITTRDNILISLHIILVLGTLAWLMLFAWRFSKIIFLLLLPYLLWGIFATILQVSLTALN